MFAPIAALALGGAALAQDATTVLAANRAATAPAGRQTNGVVELQYSYSGQGLTGTVSTRFDGGDGRFVDYQQIGPTRQWSGFDGAAAWMKEPTGTVSREDGGDNRQLAVNEAYRDANSWWRPGFGGARLTYVGDRSDGGVGFDVVEVTPADGRAFQAWFDRRTHLLARTVEPQGFQTVVTTYGDYAPIQGVMIARKVVIDQGDGPDALQTMRLTSAELGETVPAGFFSAPPPDLADTSIEGGAKETTIPFELLNNHIYIKVRVNGKGPFLFIVDTGGHNLLTPATAKLLAGRVEGQMPGHGAGEGTVEAGFAKVDSLQVGKVLLRNQVVGVVPFQSKSVEGFDADGMIGFETFRRFVTRIDYGAHTITFIEPAAFDPREAGIPVKFQLYDTIPQVRGAFEGIPGRFDIDTGSRVALTLMAPFVASAGLRASHPHGVVTVDGWGVGGRSIAYVTRARSLRLGPVTIAPVVADLTLQKAGALADPNAEGNVGAGVLKLYAVTFDYDQETMYLKPLPAPVADTGVFDRSGMWVNLGAGGLEVVDISAGGPAADAGLKIGDTIVSVEGAPAGSLDLSDLRQRLRDLPAGTALTLVVRHGGAERRVLLRLRDQV
ncbi:MAG TPA: aspartyl protease family protein [Caulobacteraceae bacterium]|nr:aspartyl protease family protein [Caulobacteraceae bacterium]